MEYCIIGGYIKVPKSVFIQEMLSKDSILRILLSWKNTSDFKNKHPMVGEPDDGDVVTINFTSSPGASLFESPKVVLGDLKAKYREKVKGKVSCTGTYSQYGPLFLFEIDLNSDGDNIEYIMR